MKFYLQKFRDNISNKQYYREVLSQPLSKGFIYYVKMSLWLVLLYTAFVSVSFVPDMVKISRQMAKDFASTFPSDLVIRLNNGEASVNKMEPIVIPMPASGSKLFNYNASKTGKVIGNLLVIDTRQNFNLTDFSKHHSLFVLNKDALGSDAGSEVKISKLPRDGGGVINKALVEQMAGKVSNVLLILAPFSVIVIYLIGLFVFALTLIPIVVISFAAWALLLVAFRKENRPRYAQALQVTLHAVTLSLVANFFSFILYPSFSLNFPFMLAFTLLVIYLNVVKKQKAAYVPPVQPEKIAADTITHPEEKK